MNYKIFNKTVSQSLRFKSTQCDVNKISNFYQNPKNYRSSSFFSTYYTRKTCTISAVFYINSHRNISNAAVASDNLEIVSNSITRDISPAEEAAHIASSHVPELLRSFSDWKIVQFAQETFMQVHETTGLPWWASIMLTTVMAKTIVTFPFSVLQVHNTEKLQMVNLEMNDITSKLKQKANFAVGHQGIPESFVKQHYQRNVLTEYNNLVMRQNCHPAKSYIVAWLQLPLWISFSFATRNLCYMLPRSDTIAQITYVELTVGGFGWITDLTHADPYIVLPIILGLVNFAVIEVHQLFRGNQQVTKFDRWRLYIIRSLAVLSVPIATFMPAAMNIYWLSSSVFGLGQAFLLHSPRFRRLFRVPMTKTEQEHPYQLFYTNLKSRLNLTDKENEIERKQLKRCVHTFFLGK